MSNAGVESKRPSARAPRPPSSRALVALAALALLVSLVAMVVLLARAWAPPRPPVAHSAPTPSSSAPAPLPEEDRTPEIRGRILDADGNPVRGARVRLVSIRPPFTVYREGETGEAGVFSFAHVGPWRVRVVGEHGDDGIVTSAVLDASERRTIDVTLVLSAAGAVRGIVSDDQGHPVAGAVVSVEGVPWIVPAATSDAAGAFRLTTVPDEATSLVAVARGFRTARAALGPRDDQVERVVRLVLVAATPVGGEVTDEDGNPIKARVVACEDQPSEARATSGDDGSFELPPSAIGCDAVAEHAEHAPSEVAPVVEGKRLALRLKAGGAIEGAAVDDRGVGLPAFTVGIESFSPARGRGFERAGPRNVEDGGGAFRWERLAPGTYVLTASAPGRPPARSTPIDVRGGAATRGVRIVVASGGVLTGYVYDEAHAPLAGAELGYDAISSAVASKASARTDSTGMYRLDGAPAGPFTLLARKDGFRTKLVSGIRLDSGATRRLDVTLATFDGGAGTERSEASARRSPRRAAISRSEKCSRATPPRAPDFVRATGSCASTATPPTGCRWRTCCSACAARRARASESPSSDRRRGRPSSSRSSAARSSVDGRHGRRERQWTSTDTEPPQGTSTARSLPWLPIRTVCLPQWSVSVAPERAAAYRPSTKTR